MARPAAKGFKYRLRSRGGDPLFSRTALCALAGISEDQLALWEYEEFIKSAVVLEVDGRMEPCYDPGSFGRLRTIRALAEDLGVNLAGIGIILHLLDQIGGPRPFDELSGRHKRRQVKSGVAVKARTAGKSRTSPFPRSRSAE